VQPVSQTLKRGLGRVIERRRDDIVRRWLERVKAENRASGIPLTELQNALPDYLLALRDELMREGEECPSPLPSSGLSAWQHLSREHAVTRVQLGFDISELVREFVVLRRVVQEVAAEESADDVRQLPVIVELLEAGIEEAVKSYVDARDYAARRVQAEHIGFLTHELRNPLNAAKLATAQLRRTATVSQQRALEVLERNHARLAELVDSVLDLQKVEANPECRPEPVRLGDLLGEAISTGRRDAEAKGLRFVTSLDRELGLELDPVLTRAAVQNLLENAVKYTDAGTVELTVDEHEREIVIHVRDSCHGISPEELRTIFQPFARGQSAKPGTGLGLAIARRSVEAQGGRIDAESTGDQGCHFWVTLPRHVVRPSAQPQPGANVSPAAPRP
jgi:signal transduction histidine kinase